MGKLGLNSGYIGSDQRTTTNGVVGYDKYFLERVNGRFFPVLEFAGLLDFYPNAAAAYSLRKLTFTYQGSAIRVRRSSDNIEQDIGFDSNGNLNTAALLAFCSGTNGFVTTWYDQSGNGRDATQSTGANQPQIVSSGSVILKNSKPEILFNTKYLTIGSSTSYFNNFTFDKTAGFAICHRDDSTGYKAIIGSNNGVSSQRGLQMATSPNYALNDYTTSGTGEISFNQTSNNTISNNTLFLYAILWDLQNATSSNRSSIYVNNGSAIKNNTRTATPSNANASYDLSIGSTVPTGNGVFNGGISEIILYPSDQTTNRIGISSNINDFYSIY
jgi:hypothetical protein